MALVNSVMQQGLQARNVQNTQDNMQLQKQQLAAAGKTGKAGAASPLKADRVSFTGVGEGAAAAGKGQTPPKFQLFSQEIEAGISRISSLVKGGQKNPSIGSMLSSQKPTIINDPSRGLVARNKEAQMQATQRANSERSQQAAQKSITSPANSSLSAIVKNLGAEMLNRGGGPAQTQAQTQVASQMMR